MRELKPTFDLLYERKRMLIKDLEGVESALKALQTRCDHDLVGDRTYSKCLICGKTVTG